MANNSRIVETIETSFCELLRPFSPNALWSVIWRFTLVIRICCAYAYPLPPPVFYGFFKEILVDQFSHSITFNPIQLPVANAIKPTLVTKWEYKLSTEMIQNHVQPKHQFSSHRIRNTSISRIPQYIGQLPHNAPFCNRNVHTCAHNCYKMVPCGIWDWCIVRFVWGYCLLLATLYAYNFVVCSWHSNTHDTEFHS